MPLEITVSARHTDISPALRAAAEDKIGRLSRFLDEMQHAEVHFSEEHNPRIAAKEVCEVTLTGGGHHLRCKASASDGFAAVDGAVEKLEHQLNKLKSRLGPRQARRYGIEPGAGASDLGAVGSERTG
jgi:putative sigma-54 modulation protein